MGQGHPTHCREAEYLAEGLELEVIRLSASDEKELAALQVHTEEDALQRG